MLTDILGEEGAVIASEADETTCIQQGRYAYDYPYTGFYQFQKHFFPNIGNLKSQGEEFECAQWLDQCEHVEWWLRNVEGKKTSFWLPTTRNKFYPDFVAKLKDGRTLVVEYKGGHIDSADDAKEKRDMGLLWAERVGKAGVFVMPTRKQWSEIADAIV